MIFKTMYFLIIAFVAFSSFTKATVDTFNTTNTTVVLKDSYREGHRYIAERVSTFKELIRRSSTIVDKSLLLKEILSDMTHRIVTLNYPPRFGKSVNLDMMKIFLQIEVDKKGNRILPLNETLGYRLFKKGELVLDTGEVEKLEKPLMISKHDDIVNEFLGKRPIIYLNFTGLNPGEGFDDLYADIVSRISDSFAEHEYMKEVFNDIIDDKDKPQSERDVAEQNLHMYEKILWKKSDTFDTQKSLNFLSSILKEYFKKKVFILVDGYDAPFNNTFLCGTFPRSQEQEFLDFYRKFIYFTFASNPHMRKAILTGIIPLARGDLLYALNDAHEYTILNKTVVHQYYGLRTEEINKLFEFFNTDNKTQKKTLRYYEGYNIGHPSKINTLELFPVIHMINTRHVKRMDSYFCQKYFAVDSIRHIFNCLLSGLQLPIDFKNITLNKADFKHLQTALYYNERSNGPIVKAFLRYALASGYVTLTEFELLGQYCIRLTTGDIFSSVGEALGLFYSTKFGPSLGDGGRNLCTNFYEEFGVFAKSQQTTSTNLTTILEKFYSYVFRPNGYIANENEEMTHLVLDYLCIFIKSFKQYPSYGTAILLFDRDIGVIVEASFNKSSADEALEKAKKSLELFYPVRMPRTKYIGINVRPPNATVDLIATV